LHEGSSTPAGLATDAGQPPDDGPASPATSGAVNVTSNDGVIYANTSITVTGGTFTGGDSAGPPGRGSARPPRQDSGGQK
jgi:hypothetical protein